MSDQVPANVTRFAAKVGLALPADRAAITMLVGRLRRRSWAAGLGSVLGAVIGGVGALLAGLGGYAPWLALGSAFVGLAFGTAIATLTESTRVPDGERRVARPRQVGFGDYVDPVELASGRVMPFLAVAFAALALVVPGAREGNAPLVATAVVLAVVALLGLVLFEVGGRRILARTRLTASPVALAWEDALRADDLRGLVNAPLAAGLYGTVLAAGALVDPLIVALAPHVGMGVVIGLIWLVIAVALAAAVTLAVLTAPRRAAQHYLRRLWPEVVAQADAARAARVAAAGAPR